MGREAEGRDAEEGLEWRGGEGREGRGRRGEGAGSRGGEWRRGLRRRRRGRGWLPAGKTRWPAGLSQEAAAGLTQEGTSQSPPGRAAPPTPAPGARSRRPAPLRCPRDPRTQAGDRASARMGRRPQLRLVQVRASRTVSARAGTARDVGVRWVGAWGPGGGRWAELRTGLGAAGCAGQPSSLSLDAWSRRGVDARTTQVNSEIAVATCRGAGGERVRPPGYPALCRAALWALGVRASVPPPTPPLQTPGPWTGGSGDGLPTRPSTGSSAPGVRTPPPRAWERLPAPAPPRKAASLGTSVSPLPPSP